MKIRLAHPCGLSHPDGATSIIPPGPVDITGYAKAANITPDRVVVEMIGLPPKQREAVENVIKRQGVERLLAVDAPTGLTPWLGLTFEHIYIGVESDGYAHT